MHNILIAGVGGTGVVTASGLLGLAAHLEGKHVVQLDQTGLAQKYGAVLSHVRIATDRERLHGMRIPAGQVDLLLGADLIVAAGKEPLAMLAADRSAVIVNTHEEMPSSFIRERDFVFPGKSLLQQLRAASRADGLATLDATRLASALLGDSIGANVLMLGFAFQRGLLPVSGAALYRALELYGRNVDENKLAFDWGRFAAESPEQVDRLANARDVAACAGQVAAGGDRAARRVPHGLPEPRLRRALSRARRAHRGRRAACAARAAASCRRPSRATTSALLAYKDEYEVARLHTETRVRRQHAAQLRRRRAHELPLLAAAVRAARSGDGPAEEVRVRAVDRCPCCACSPSCRRMRGTWLDPFGYSADRRLERELIRRYEAAARSHRGRARRVAIRRGAAAREPAARGARLWSDQAGRGRARGRGSKPGCRKTCGRGAAAAACAEPRASAA